MAEDDAAQSAIADATAKTGADGLDRKVTVEVIHKQEGWGAAAWTAIGMLLIVAVIGSWYMMSGDGPNGSGGLFGSDGNCGDGIDNDNDGRTDEADGDCYDQVNPSFQGYKKGHSEDGRNDPPSDGE
ncbi:MAG: hypothetical protein QF831_00730 [Candidatus Thalassarchaeaceae archaeon]|jgi:hypothetical protein|nr:hypothetical protein [Candidatus Thalassarchaeaceae archaeon]